MRLTIEHDSSALRLCYEVRNDGEEDLFLANLIVDSAGFFRKQAPSPMLTPPPRVTSELAYAFHVAPDTAAFLQGRIKPPPEFTGTAPVQPLFHRIAPGEAHAATIHAALPLVEWNAYAPPVTEGTREVMIQRVTVRVEYILRSAATYLRVRDERRGIFQVWQSSRWPSFSAEAKLARPVPMLVRGDDFTRVAS